ncbi:MAG: hypothetical protein LH632_20525 [Rhodoferax sp.]|nr:hypothetical protein [Rhodoferax sp.]
MNHFCGPATPVSVDGRPLVSGDRIPATAFTVRWEMDHCQPFSASSVALSGVADLTVFHENTGMSAAPGRPQQGRTAARRAKVLQ